MTSIRLLAPTTAFGIGLLKNEVKTHQDENVLISPISVSASRTDSNPKQIELKNAAHFRKCD